MADAVSFWLDNKMSSGIKVAEIGSQTLVSYRDKFYVVEKGAALMKGSRPLHYSKSSIPTIWRKVIRGGTPIGAIVSQEEENMPMATTTKKERSRVKKVLPTADESPAPLQTSPEAVQTELKQTAPAKPQPEAKQPRSVKKTETKPAVQAAVVTACPYCSHKHDIPLEKGKSGKAFLVGCSRCSNEFAVRFVPVTVYQAQVAAFS